MKKHADMVLNMTLKYPYQSERYKGIYMNILNNY